MDIKVGDYKNAKINMSGAIWTRKCTLIADDGFGISLGGVDHFMKKSVRALVAYYVRRLKTDESYGYPGAKYTLIISASKSICGPSVDTTFKIPIEVI